MEQRRTISAALLLAALLAAPALAHEADAITVQVGAGQDTTVISSFLPEVVRVKVGEPVTFRLVGDEIHTVTLLGHDQMPAFAVPVEGEPRAMQFNPQVAFPTRMPGAPVESYDGSGYVNSGVLSHEPGGPDAPPNDHFTLVFTEPGTYEYFCFIHPWMKGTVVVEPETATGLPSHQEIDDQAQEQEGALLTIAEAIPVQRSFVRSEPGPNDTTLWYALAGAVDMNSADPRVAVFEYFPRDLTINAGDTVVWTSNEFHTVSFVPVPPDPREFDVRPQEQGPPQLVLNPQVWAAAKPSGVYDPEQYYNSGMLGPFFDEGYTWALTFDQPGTYEYHCALHKGMGMEGTVTVLPR